jgi:hypothetical protein
MSHQHRLLTPISYIGKIRNCHDLYGRTIGFQYYTRKVAIVQSSGWGKSVLCTYLLQRFTFGVMICARPHYANEAGAYPQAIEGVHEHLDKFRTQEQWMCLLVSLCEAVRQLQSNQLNMSESQVYTYMESYPNLIKSIVSHAASCNLVTNPLDVANNQKPNLLSSNSLEHQPQWTVLYCEFHQLVSISACTTQSILRVRSLTKRTETIPSHP